MSTDAEWPTEAPTSGLKLPNHSIWMPMLEEERAAAVRVPFADVVVVAPAASASGGQEQAAAAKTKLASVLDEHGFAIVTGVFSAFDVEVARALFASDLLQVIDHDQSDPEVVGRIAADPIANWPLRDGVTLGASFVSDFGLVQGRAAWYVRAHPNVAAVFGDVHTTPASSLVSSCDTIFFENRAAVPPPWELVRKRRELLRVVEGLQVPGANQQPSSDSAAAVASEDGSGEKGAAAAAAADEDDDPELAVSRACCGSTTWPHVDQNKQLLGGKYGAVSNVLSVQGVLTLQDLDERSSATVIWPQSHRDVAAKMFDEFNFGLVRGHYVPLPNAIKPGFIRGARRIPLRAGDMLLWNSLTAHQGWNQGPRLAFPVVLEPAARRPADALARKHDIVVSGGPSTHWASLGIKHDIGYRDRAITHMIAKGAGVSRKSGGDNEEGNAATAPVAEKGRLTLAHRAHLWLLRDKDAAGNIVLPPTVARML